MYVYLPTDAGILNTRIVYPSARPYLTGCPAVSVKSCISKSQNSRSSSHVELVRIACLVHKRHLTASKILQTGEGEARIYARKYENILDVIAPRLCEIYLNKYPSQKYRIDERA